MKAYKLPFAAIMLFATSINAYADGNAGTLTRQGKQTKYEAVHVEPPWQMNFRAEAVVFSDNAAATDFAAHKVSYGTVDGMLTVNTVANQLWDHGAHPIQVTIQPAPSDASPETKDQRTVEIEIWNKKGTRPLVINETANTADSKLQLNIVREDEKRFEGTLKYADKKQDVTLDLAFALDQGPFVWFGKKLEAPEPPPPPPPPPPPKKG